MKQATLSALETRDSVRSRFLFALAKELQVPADWLMDGNESLLTPQDRQMVRMAIGAIAQAKHKLPLATSLKRGASKR